MINPVTLLFIIGLVLGSSPTRAASQACDTILVDQINGVANSYSEEVPKEKELQTQEKLHVGITIHTQLDSNVKISLCDGSVLHIGSKTLFKIEETNIDERGAWAWAFSLTEGIVRANIGNKQKQDHIKFRIKTPVATLGSNESEFVVQVNAIGETAAYNFAGELFLGSVSEYHEMKKTHNAKIQKYFQIIPIE